MAKCNYCGTDIDTLPHQCNHCSRTYCPKHRLPEKHECVGISSATSLGPDFRRPDLKSQSDAEKTDSHSKSTSSSASMSRRNYRPGFEDSEPVAHRHRSKKPQDRRSEIADKAQSSCKGEAGKRHRDWKPSSTSPDVVVDKSGQTSKSSQKSKNRNKLPLGFRINGVYKRIQRTFWRYIPSVMQVVVLGLIVSVTLLVVSSVGGVGIGPVDEVSDRTSDVVDQPLGAINNITQDVTTSSTDPVKVGTSNTDFERAIHTEINTIRREHSLQPLEYNEALASIGRNHSRDMAARDYFDHTSPEGWEPSDRVAASDKVQCRVGENIYTESGFSVSNPVTVAERTVESWMNSPGHRENILREGWSMEGIGVHIDGRDVWVTQMFC